MTKLNPKNMTAEEIALEKYNKGEKHSVSTFIDEDTIIAGYGQLFYDFEFPLPKKKIIEIYGTNSWDEYFNNKGLFRWESLNKNTGEKSLLIRMKIEDIENLKKVKGNENFEFKRI